MTEDQLRKIYQKTGGHCHFCGDRVFFKRRGWKEGSLYGYWEVDHVIQRKKGGSRSSGNCLPACTRCNRLRWHRKGEDVRELLLLGIIARDQIRKSNAMGKDLSKLKKRRLEQNKKRRTPHRSRRRSD